MSDWRRTESRLIMPKRVGRVLYPLDTPCIVRWRPESAIWRIYVGDATWPIAQDGAHRLVMSEGRWQERYSGTVVEMIANEREGR